MKKIAVLLFIFGSVWLASAKPYEYGSSLQTHNLGECYGITCPSETTACRRVIKTSDDRQNLNTNIHCLDINGYELSSTQRSAPNSNPHTQITSYSFTGHTNTNINNVLKSYRNDVESF